MSSRIWHQSEILLLMMVLLLGPCVLAASEGPTTYLDDGSSSISSRDSPADTWSMFRHDAKHTGRSAFDTSTNPGDIVWRFMPRGLNKHISNSPAIGNDGRIYFTSYDQSLYSLYPNGTMAWRFETENIPRTTPAIDANGTVYFMNDDAVLFAVNPNGTQRWNISFEKQPNSLLESSSPIIANDTLYVASDEGIHALTLTGLLNWTYKTANFIGSPPTVDDNGTVIFTEWDYLTALKPDGTVLWRFPLAINNRHTPVIGPDNTVYICSENYLFAIAPSGLFKWKFSISSSDQWEPSDPAIGKDGTLYFGGYRSVFALDHAGNKIWSYDDGADMHSPPAIGQDGTVYISNRDGYLLALSSDGKLKWSNQMEEGAAIAPSIGPDGTVYAIDERSFLYAFGDNGSVPYELALPPEPPNPVWRSTGDKYIELRWDVPNPGSAPILGYNIYRGQSKRIVPYATVGAKTPVFRDTDVEYNRTYWYQISAKNKYGESWYGGWYGISIAPTYNPPVGLNVSQSGDLVVLSWEAPQDQAGLKVNAYRIYRRTNDMDWDTLKDLGAGQTDYTDTDVEANRTYQYKIKALYPNGGESNMTSEVSIEVKDVGGPDDDLPPVKDGPRPRALSLMIVGAVSSLTLGTVILLGVVFGTDLGRYKLFTSALSLHTKLKGDKILDNIIRGRIIEFVLMNPGTTFTEIGTHLELDNGTLAYHIRVLERGQYIKSVTSGIHRRFFPFEHIIPEDTTKTIQETIIEIVGRNTKMSRKDLVTATGASASTVNYHCTLLVRAGVLQSSKVGKSKIYSLIKKVP